MRIRTVLLGCCLLSAAVFAAAGDPADFADRVGTLELDARLDARGNLGGMTIDRLGFVYVANFRDAVWRISPEGEVKELSRSLYGSSGNAIDSRGDLYQASFFGNTITRISRAGDEDIVVRDALSGPVGLAFGEDDTLYICNCNGNSIVRMAPDGAVDRFVESELFACPNGITLGEDGNFYVTNFNNTDIHRITPEGEISVFVTVPGGAGNAHIAQSKDMFYVTRIISNQVVRIAADGEIRQIAGTGQVGHDDGPGPAASLAHPNGITVSPLGDRLYVNTMIGPYNQQQPSEISLRTIDLVTLTRVLDAAMARGGLEAAMSAYRRYKEDPLRGKENTVREMVGYGYRLLSSRQVAAALEIFSLNAASYPEVAIAQYQLGEAYRYAGQVDSAVAQYRKTLDLEPGHALATARLTQLGGGNAGT